MSGASQARALAPRRTRVAGTTALASPRGIALGFLTMLPLIAIYECAVSAANGGARNTAEMLVSLPLQLCAPHADGARWLLLAVCTAAAVWASLHAHLGLGARLWRVLLEGFGAAIALGPILVGLLWLLDVRGPVALQAPANVRAPIEVAAFHLGGAAYEEIVFRIGLQSLLYALFVELLAFFTGHEPVARIGAEIAALVLGALVFAAAHLGVFTQGLGPGGEPFDLGLYAWRFAAGLALGALFRWRGPGVSAWAHGFFNLALFIGAGPGVFL